MDLTFIYEEWILFLLVNVVNVCIKFFLKHFFFTLSPKPRHLFTRNFIYLSFSTLGLIEHDVINGNENILIQIERCGMFHPFIYGFVIKNLNIVIQAMRIALNIQKCEIWIMIVLKKLIPLINIIIKKNWPNFLKLLKKSKPMNITQKWYPHNIGVKCKPHLNNVLNCRLLFDPNTKLCLC